MAELTPQMVQTPRLAMNVWTSGPEDGRPILLVHGNITTGGYWRYVADLLPDDVRVIAPDMRAFGRTEQKPIDATRGLGDMADDVHGLGHSGSTLYFQSNMVVVPALKLGVFISANTDTSWPLTDRLPSRIIQQFYQPPQPFPRPGSPELVRSAGVFEGYYLSARRAYSGLEKFVGLMRDGTDVEVTPDGRLTTASGDTVAAWAPQGNLRQGLFASTTGSQHLAFQIRDGRAVSFQTALNGGDFERASLWQQPRVLTALAILSLLAAAATLGGVLFRNRREFRETPIQGRASLIQNTQAVLWLTAGALFVLWLSKTSDVAKVVYTWPGATLVVASACALVSATLTLITLVMLPAVWRGGRRVDSWTALRKTAFSVTVLIYGAFTLVLALWGALSPWS